MNTTDQACRLIYVYMWGWRESDIKYFGVGYPSEINIDQHWIHLWEVTDSPFREAAL